ELFIEAVNGIITWIWGILPGSVVTFLNDFLDNILGIQSGSAGPLIDPTSAGTWLFVLVFFVLLATLIARSTLPNYGPGGGYAVRPTGGLLGALLGGLNGLIIANLVREYLDGRNLPGGAGGTFPTEITQAGGASVGITSADIGIRAVELPSFTILDSFLPWIIIIIAVVIFLMAIRNRVILAKNPQGFRRIEYRPPYGYERY
ncbi:MAG: hypothetical protein R3264_18090, partial [Anaerolineae bacterium]|nr:hypothetical protein [Anaerolineae bacterium]